MQRKELQLRSNGRIAGFKAVQNLDHVIFSVVKIPYPRFLETKPTRIIMDTQRRPPTPRPEINSLPMETFAIHP